MEIKFEDPNSIFYDMLEEWAEKQRMGQEPLLLDHYELATGSRFSANDWKAFLTNPQVVDEMNKEFILMQQSKVKKLISSVDSETRSTGTAQIINALTANIERGTEGKNTGPAFIYTFVPLNNEQQHAQNVHILDHNPFIEEDYD